jgi:hypothetical protein
LLQSPGSFAMKLSVGLFRRPVSYCHIDPWLEAQGNRRGVLNNEPDNIVHMRHIDAGWEDNLHFMWEKRGTAEISQRQEVYTLTQ